jgi:hypothetical protein
MKAVKVLHVQCAEGSRSTGPGRIAKPDKGQTGMQRDVIVIQKPAPKK